MRSFFIYEQFKINLKKESIKKIENFYKIFAQQVQPKTYFLHDT